LQGETGPQGFTGFQGNTGPQGVTGIQGVTGPQGETGLQGHTGPQGFTGLQGETGPQGWQGFTGPQGYQGLTGPQGSTGFQGQSGPQGDSGPQGNTGSQGDTGPQGSTGLQGLSGPQGNTGPQGSTGTQGETGPQGPAVQPNISFTFSSVDLITITHNSGNYPFVQIFDNTGNVFVPDSIIHSTTASFELIFATYTSGTIVYGGGAGPQGPVGDPGPPGGPPGPTGIQGPTGPQGYQGFTGPQGFTGGQGLTGPQGNTGIQGNTGFQGPTGNQGITGPQGFTGLQGQTGPQGPAGQSSNYFPYYATYSLSGNPDATFLLWNNSTQISATQVNISHLDGSYVDVDIFLAQINDQDTLIIQDQDNSDNYQKFIVNGSTTIIANSYSIVPVNFATSSGVGTTNFSNGQHLALFIFSSGLAGPQGTTGPQGFSGPQGYQGWTGPSGITKGSFGITLDGGDVGITTGSKGYASMPYNGSITGWSILGNASGSIQIDLKKSTYNDFPTTNSITATNYITLTSQQKNSDQTLTGWSVTFSASDVYEFVVNSVNTVTKVNIVISTNKTS
jgi:hypothetical protein